MEYFLLPVLPHLAEYNKSGEGQGWVWDNADGSYFAEISDQLEDIFETRSLIEPTTPLSQGGSIFGGGDSSSGDEEGKFEAQHV